MELPLLRGPDDVPPRPPKLAKEETDVRLRRWYLANRAALVLLAEGRNDSDIQ